MELTQALAAIDHVIILDGNLVFGGGNFLCDNGDAVMEQRKQLVAGFVTDGGSNVPINLGPPEGPTNIKGEEGLIRDAIQLYQLAGLYGGDNSFVAFINDVGGNLVAAHVEGRCFSDSGVALC